MWRTQQGKKTDDLRSVFLSLVVVFFLDYFGGKENNFFFVFIDSELQIFFKTFVDAVYDVR